MVASKKPQPTIKMVGWGLKSIFIAAGFNQRLSVVLHYSEFRTHN